MDSVIYIKIRVIVILVIVFIQFFVQCQAALVNEEFQSADDHGTMRGSRTGTDVEVTNIVVEDYFIVPGIYANKHYIGREVDISVYVGNTGTSGIGSAFDVQLTILDDADEVNATYKLQMNKTVNGLPSQNFEQLEFYWLPPETPPQNAKWNYSDTGNHTFTLRASSLYGNDDNNSNNELTSNVTIFEPHFAPEITNTVWEDSGPVEMPILITAPFASIVHINFTVNNTANETDFIVPELFDMPEDWALLPGSLPDFLQIQPGKGKTVRTRIQMSMNHSLALHNHDYSINIRAYSLFARHQNDTFWFIVNPGYSPKAQFITPGSVTCEPGTNYVKVTLVNIGNGRDIYSTSAEVFPGSTDWDAIIYSGAKTKLLNVGESTPIVVKVEVPPKRKDSYKTIIVTAQSIAVPNYTTADQYKFKVIVGTYHGVGLELAEEVPTPILLDPSEEYSFDVIVTNKGNTKDPTINISVTDQPEAWLVDLNTSMIPEDGLGIGVDVNIGVKIKTPEFAPPGSLSITITGFADDPAEAHVTLIIPVDIIEVIEFSVRAEPEEHTANASEMVSYKLHLQNLGNSEDVYDVYVPESCPIHDWTNLPYITFSLMPNNTFELALMVVIPYNASADADPDTPEVIDPYTINVTFISNLDPSHIMNISVILRIDPVPDFIVTADNRTVTILKGSDETEPVHFKISNTGNVADIYGITLETGEKWVSLTKTTLSVLPYHSDNFQLLITPPGSVGIGTYEFIINVTSVFYPDIYQQFIMTIKIKSLEISIIDLRLVGAKGNPQIGYTVKPGSQVKIEVAVKNTGTLDFNNETFTECLLVIQDGKATIATFYIDSLKVTLTANFSVFFVVPDEPTDLVIYANIDPYEEIPLTNRDNTADSILIEVERDTDGDSIFSTIAGNQYQLSLLIAIIILVIIGSIAFIRIRRRRSQDRDLLQQKDVGEEGVGGRERIDKDSGSVEDILE